MPEWLIVALTAAGAALAGIFAAAGTGLKGLISAYFARRERSLKRDEYASGFDMMLAYPKVIALLKANPLAERYCLFRGVDGKGLPRPGEPYTVRAMDGWSSKAGADPMVTYGGDLMVDSRYVEMLIKMIRDKKVINITAEMPEDSALRSYYESEGVVCTILFFVHIDEWSNSLHYISVGSYSAAYTPRQIVMLERSIEQLRAVFTRD